MGIMSAGLRYDQMSKDEKNYFIKKYFPFEDGYPVSEGLADLERFMSCYIIKLMDEGHIKFTPGKPERLRNENPRSFAYDWLMEDTEWWVW